MKKLTPFENTIKYLNQKFLMFNEIDENINVYIPNTIFDDTKEKKGTLYQIKAAEELFEQTILTSKNIAIQLLNGSHVLIIGLPQSDKSASQFLAATLFSVIYYLKTNKFCAVLFTSPHSNSKYEGQLKEKFRKISPIINEIVVQYNNKKISISEYYSAIEQQIFDRCESKAVFALLNNQKNGGFKTIRLSKQLKDKFSNLCEELISLNCLPLIVRDEIHLNSKEGSINDQTFEEEAEETYFGNCFDMFNDKKALFMPVSATPWNSLHFKMVPIEFDKKTYCGFPQRYKKNGEEKFLCPDLMPEVKSFDELDPFFKKYIKLNLPVCFSKQNKFKKSGIGGSWEDFRKNYAKALYKVISMLYKTNRHTPKGIKINGTLIRFINNNAVTEELIDLIKEENKDQNMNFYYMFDDGTKSVDQFLHENSIDLENQNKKYVIFVTANARSSDSFPTSVGYFFDCTDKASNWTALFQGIVGRAHGYNKNPIIVLSHKNKQLLEKHKNNGWSCEDASNEIPLLTGLENNTRQKIYHTVEREKLNNKELCKQIEERNNNYGKFGKQCKINIANFLDYNIINQLISDELPDHQLVSFNDKKYARNDNGDICLAKRTTNIGQTKGNVNGKNIIVRFENTKSKEKFISLDLLVEPKLEKHNNKNGHMTGKINND